MPVTPHNLRSAGAPWTVVGGYASLSLALSPMHSSTPLRGGASHDLLRRSAELKLRFALLSLARRLT